MMRAGGLARHRRGESYAVRANSILGGLHHEYFLAPVGARPNNCGPQVPRTLSGRELFAKSLFGGTQALC